MKRSFLVLCFFFLLIGCTRNNDLFSFKLFSADNSPVDFSQLKNNKATVFIFLAPDCPISQNYTLTLNSLTEQFRKNNIVFYGIIAGNDFAKKEVDDFVDKYRVSFPVLSDVNLNLMEYFKATKTPEVFVVNSGEKILYKGAIDNWASDLGIHRKVITGHYLEDALHSIIKNTEVKIKETKAVGCFIERKRQRL